MPAILDDTTAAHPQNSYGAQKLACEYLIADMSRRGLIDGRNVRLPTVVVRPGKANAAASSFASAVIREPLEGRAYTCPVDPDTAIWVVSPRQVVAALMRSLALPAAVWGGAQALKLPGITVTVKEMLDAVERVAGTDVAGLVDFVPEPFIQNIISAWPARFHLARAPALGFCADDSIDAIVAAFLDDDCRRSPADG